MNICIVTSSFPRWVGDYAGVFVFEMSRHLVKKDNKVCVVAPHFSGTKLYEEREGIKIYRFKYMMPEKHQKLTYFFGISKNLQMFPMARFEPPFYFLSCARKVASVAKRENADILFPQWVIPQGLICLTLKHIIGLPIAIMCHGSDIFLARTTIAKMLVRYVLNHSEVVLVNSKATLTRALRLGISKMPTVVWQGVDLQKFYPFSYDTKRKYFTVLFVGRLTEVKGIKYLLRAIEIIKQHKINVKLKIVGNGPLYKKLLNYVKTHNLQDSVLFIRQVPHNKLIFFYADCDVFVLPSIVTSKGETEALGTAILEAMACGKPVIGSNIGGIREVIENGRNGFLVEPKNPSVLADRIIKLLLDEPIRERFGRNSREIAKKFSWEKIVLKIENALRDGINYNLIR